MKVWGIPNGPQGRGTKINGAIVTVKRKDGSVIVRSWPRRRGSYQSKRQREWGEWFAAASRWATSPDPGSQEYALRTVVGTIFMPRDLLLKIARGNLWEVQLSDGTVLWNMWQMADQIQVELDTITQTPGAMLFRGPNGWVGLSPGPDGYQLITTGTGPQWLPRPSVGSPTPAYLPQVLSRISTSNNVTKGTIFTPALRILIGACRWNMRMVDGHTYEQSIWTYEGGKLVELLGKKAFTGDITQSDYNFTVVFDAPVEIAPNKQVAFLLADTTLGATQLQIRWSDLDEPMNFPWVSPQPNYFISPEPPRAGLENAGTGNQWHGGWIYGLA